MNRENFARLCLIISIVGLGLMYASDHYFEVESVDASKITSQDVGDAVTVDGNVSNFYSTESASFFTLEDDSGDISVADFDARAVDRGEKVQVTGQVDLYQGDVQIVASEIKRIN